MDSHPNDRGGGSRMMYPAFDNKGNPIQVPGVLVACEITECENHAIEIEVPDDPYGYVVCGVCGSVLRVGTKIPSPE